MSEFIATEGTVESVKKDNTGFKLNGTWYTQYRPIDEKIYIGSYVKFTYKTKVKDDRTFYNIVDGSLVVQNVPRDITDQYSQEPQKIKKETAQLSGYGTDSSVSLKPDTNTMIVRQSCLKAAVEVINIAVGKQETKMIDGKLHAEIPRKMVTSLAEEFEKWVMR